MKIAHVRHHAGPHDGPWRLAAAVDGPRDTPERWLDLEVLRRRMTSHDPGLPDRDALFGRPVTTLDDHLARGFRVERLRRIVESFEPGAVEDEAVLAAGDLAFGPPILRPASLRDFYAFERHVRTMWERRKLTVPEAWYRLPIFYFSNVSEIRGPGDPVWAPRGSSALDYELEVAALIDTAGRDLAPDHAEEVIGGYMILNDWSARDLQTEEMALQLGPAKGKDFANSIGPWLVTPDELADARAATGYDLSMTATVNGTETSRGRWSDAHFSFGQMLARASSDARLEPGDLVGSGTVGTGCLLEVRRDTLGRYLEPGDQVTLRVDRLGALTSPVVSPPGRPERANIL
jgi:fumarylacetoacetate (FAA) hydrolase